MAVAPWVVSDGLWERVAPLLPKVARRFRFPGPPALVGGARQRANPPTREREPATVAGLRAPERAPIGAPMTPIRPEQGLHAERQLAFRVRPVLVRLVVFPAFRDTWGQRAGEPSRLHRAAVRAADQRTLAARGARFVAGEHPNPRSAGSGIRAETAVPYPIVAVYSRDLHLTRPPHGEDGSRASVRRAGSSFRSTKPIQVGG